MTNALKFKNLFITLSLLSGILLILTFAYLAKIKIYEELNISIVTIESFSVEAEIIGITVFNKEETLTKIDSSSFFTEKKYFADIFIKLPENTISNKEIKLKINDKQIKLDLNKQDFNDNAYSYYKIEYQTNGYITNKIFYVAYCSIVHIHSILKPYIITQNNSTTIIILLLIFFGSIFLKKLTSNNFENRYNKLLKKCGYVLYIAIFLIISFSLINIFDNTLHFRLYYIELVLIIAALSILGILVFSKQLKSINIYSKYLMFIIIFFGYFWLIFASFFTFPNAEDLSLVVEHIHFGSFAASNNLLIHYDARFFTNLLYGFSPLAIGGINYYKLTPILSLIILNVVTFLIVNLIFSKKINILKCWLIALSFNLIHFFMIPYLAHQLYCMSSSFVYINFWIFVCLWIYFLIKCIKAEKNISKITFLILAKIFLVFSFGTNEMSLVFNNFMIISLMYLIFKYYPKEKHYIISFFVLGVFLSTFLVLIPSNSSKLISDQHLAQADFDLIFTNFSSGLFLTLKTLIFWLINHPVVICGFMFMFLLFSKLNIREKIILNTKELIIFTGGLFICIFLMPLAYYIPMGIEYIPHRIYNLTNFLFLTIVFFFLPLIALSFKANKISKAFLNVNNTPILVILIIFTCYYSFFQNNNIKTIRLEYYTGLFSGYKSEMQNRYKLIEDAKNNNDIWQLVIIPELKFKPTIVFITPDILPNRAPYNYWNVAYEGFFGVDEIRIENDTVNKIKMTHKNADD